MTLYIAVCDDNIAQRKQTERLLNREKDARLKSSGDVLYIESFGSSDALMKTPIKYDMFFIDVTCEEQNGADIAEVLRNKGIVAPIVLISSTINYVEVSPVLANIIHTDSPISQNTISLMIDKAAIWSAQKPSYLELRCKESTHYISPSDVMKAEFRESLLTMVTLSDGSSFEITDSLGNFYSMCHIYGDFLFLGKSLVNFKYVEKHTRSLITLASGETLRIGLLYRKKTISRINKLSAEQK